MPVGISRLPEPPLYRHSVRSQEAFARYKSSKVPVGGWTQQSFQQNGKALLRDILAARKLALRDNVPKLTKALIAMFEQEQEAVLVSFIGMIRKHHSKTIGSDLVNVVLELLVPDGSEGLWEAALNAVFSEGGVHGRILNVFRPSYQSTMTQIVDKTISVLVPKEDPADPLVPVAYSDDPLTHVDVVPDLPTRRVTRLSKKEMDKVITRKADKLCMKVTRISATTRRRMQKFFDDNIKAGTTVKEMIEKMKLEFPKVTKDRAARIVRNELSLAANAAQILSFKESRTVTHCSVIGCQAIEDNSPEYKGFHTCNIRNVPVADLEEVEFHIGHTGSWVPSGFIKADGTAPTLRLGNSPGIGKYDDPNALRHRLAKPKR